MVKSQRDLSKLMDDYVPYVVKIVSSVGGHYISKEDAEEVISDVFYAIWKKRKNLMDGKDIKPYMAQIARNMTKNKMREHARLSAEIIVHIEEVECVDESTLVDKLIRSEQIEEIQNIVNSFDNPEKEILYSYYFYDFKLGEIAGRLNLPLSTVKSKLYRSRKKLKDMLVEGGVYENCM